MRMVSYVFTIFSSDNLTTQSSLSEGGPGTANNAPEDKSNRGFRLVYNQQPCMSGK